MPERTLSVNALRTALHCPRQYEFEHVQGLAAETEPSTADHRCSLLAPAICAGLRGGSDSEREPKPEPEFETNTDSNTDSDPSSDSLESAIRDELRTRWDDPDRDRTEWFHSHAQRDHEQRVLEATVRSYVETVGAAHASGIRALEDELGSEPVGPGLSLVSSRWRAKRGITLETTVDYVTLDAATDHLTAVHFVPTTAPLGLLRYRPRWEGDVQACFEDHFDPDEERFEPAVVASLIETAVVLDGLRERRDQWGLPDRHCRYVQIPVADRSATSVNWIRNRVETSIEPVDLTSVYADDHTVAQTFEHRNATVERQIGTVLEDLEADGFEPGGRWETIRTHVCADCPYTVCCQDFLAHEVRFDG